MIKIRTRFYILLFILFGLLIFGQSLVNRFVGDDIDQIVQNSQIKSILNIPQLFTGSTYSEGQSDRLTGIYYRPLMLSVFTIIYSVGGLDPLFYHFFQLTIHITNSILLFFFLNRFLKKEISFFASLIFLIHPINSESVLYIANLQETLFFFFGLLAFLITSKKNFNKNQSYLILTNILIMCSLLSKESGILFILIILVYYFIFFKQNVTKLFVSYTTTFLFYLLLRFGVAKMNLAQDSIAPITNASLLERIINIPEIILFYIKSFFAPYDLIVAHFWIIKQINLSQFFIPLLIDLLFFVCLFLFGGWIYKKKNVLFKSFLFFFCWFIIGLLLHLNIIPLDVTVADRWSYFPIVGLLGMIGTAWEGIKVKNTKIISFIMIVIAISLSFRTYIRTYDWKDSLSLYKHDLKYSTNNFYLQNGIAAELIRSGKYKEAKPYLENSIKIFPYFANVNNMAIIYLSENNIPKTKEYLKKAFYYGNNYTLYQNYSNFLLYYESAADAVKFTKSAVKKYPSYSKLWLNLAKAEYRLGNKTIALQAAETSLKLEDNLEAKLMIEKIRGK